MTSQVPASVRDLLSKLVTRFVVAPAVQAGFPSPAADYLEEGLDFNVLLVRNPPATFSFRAEGDSLKDLGIFDGDVVVVDRSVPVVRGQVVVGSVDGDFYVKVYGKVGGRMALVSANETRAADYPPIFLDQCDDYQIFGCVTGIVRTFGPAAPFRTGRR